MATPLWLDKLRAVPFVGFRFTPLYTSSSALVDAAQSILARWSENGGKPEIRLDSPTSVTLDSGTGYSFGVTHEQVVGQFSYRAKVIAHPNQDPTIQPNQPPDLFSNLLDKTAEQTIELFDALYQKRPRQLRRIGIVAQTSLAPDRVPPGVQALISHIGDPWVEGLDGYNAMLSAVLRKQDGIIEKCHHTLRRMEVEDDAVDQVFVSLDWQRLHTPPTPVSRQKLEQLVNQCKQGSIAYFETFGLGDLKYEK